MTLLAATPWRSNAELIAAIAAHGYIEPDDKVLDLTFGEGTWWKTYAPSILHANVRTVAQVPAWARDGWRFMTCDYTHSDEFDWGVYDVVAFDPPYVAKGGRETSGIAEFDARFGLKDAARTPWELHEYNAKGLSTARLAVRPDGLILVKCQDYISSGRLQLASHWMLNEAMSQGLEVVDRFFHVGHVRPQPATTTCRICNGAGALPEKGESSVDLAERDTWGPCEYCGGTGQIPRRVVHARQNASQLLVLRRRRGS